MNIRQANGTSKPVDIRTLPFVRFEDNEAHSNGFWGLNLGQHSGGKVGPDPRTPFIIRNMKIWNVFGGYGVEVPNVVIDTLTVHRAECAVRESKFVAQDYRNVSFNSRNQTITNLAEYHKNGSLNRNRHPGFPQGKADGGATVQAPEIEVAKLNPIDKLPPITVITGFQKDGSKLIVRGTTSDNGSITKVLVNDKEAHALTPNFGQWVIVLDGMSAGQINLTAFAQDQAGNVEQTKRNVTVVVR